MFQKRGGGEKEGKRKGMENEKSQSQFSQSNNEKVEKKKKKRNMF